MILTPPIYTSTTLILLTKRAYSFGLKSKVINAYQPSYHFFTKTRILNLFTIVPDSYYFEFQKNLKIKVQKN